MTLWVILLQAKSSSFEIWLWAFKLIIELLLGISFLSSAVMASEGAGPWELEELMLKTYFGFTLDKKKKLIKEE